MGSCVGRCSHLCGGDDGELPPKLRPPQLLNVILGLICVFCYVCVSVSFFLSPTTVLACLAVVFFFGVLATGEGSAWERNYPSTIFLGPISAVSVLLAFYIGVKIYIKIYAPYYLAVSGREYTGVEPSARTEEYADAGILKFTPDASLDTSRSFGLKGNDFTYCVAPVVSRSAAVHPHSSGPQISFWAVGRDCCGNRQNFECDGASETEVRSAFAVRDLERDWLTRLVVPRTMRPQYLKAVNAAKALHDLESENEEEIILLRWATDPETTLKVWYDRAILSCTLACFIFGIVITGLWTFVHVYFERKIRGLALEEYGQRV